MSRESRYRAHLDALRSFLHENETSLKHAINIPSVASRETGTRPRINISRDLAIVSCAAQPVYASSSAARELPSSCSQLWRSCLARHVYTMRNIHLYGWHSTWHQSWLMSPRWWRETAISHRYMSSWSWLQTDDECVGNG